VYCYKSQEFAGEDNSDLFLAEREAAIVQAQQEKRQMQLTVPGIIGPHELPEEMQD
jgi:exportin-1